MFKGWVQYKDVWVAPKSRLHEILVKENHKPDRRAELAEVEYKEAKSRTKQAFEQADRILKARGEQNGN